MDDKQTENSGPNKGQPAAVARKTAAKSFITIGPTLHYSHSNVLRCWFGAVVVYALVCLFWSKILTGSLCSFDVRMLWHAHLWRLDRFVLSGVSIFEYPWQILVLGLLMGALTIAPVLVSQLLSFSYSLPLILAVVFLANLPGFAIFLLISCVAAASRPLRFRSRFTAIALCIAPQLIYWGVFGPAAGVEPMKWGLSFAPWVCAWLVSLAIAGLVLGIGHFTRYRPGLVWTCTSAALCAAVILFEVKIGFDELDYQLYVAKNNPENVREFYDHSLVESLDATIMDPVIKKYLAGFFYPSEPIALREQLKKEMEIQLANDRWPTWFKVPEHLDYQAKKQKLFEQYDLFISKRSKSNRMPIVLYYKALLGEYSPDIAMLVQKELLHFASDYPQERSRETWYRLYSQFGTSPESIEARWRIAKHWAGQGRFEHARQLLGEAEKMVPQRLQVIEQSRQPATSISALFHPPADSVITSSKLIELQGRLNRLSRLIGPENIIAEPASAVRLATFVMLNPQDRHFTEQLDRLLGQMGTNDPLRDNCLLAGVKLVADDRLRAERFDQLHKQFQATDAGIEALYELGLLKISFWYQHDAANAEQKKKSLGEMRAVLSDFLRLYPDSVFADQVRKNLDDLPKVE
ncbi:MAG TPA: hypothetical protein VMW23_01850 [Sedimentisphaerales bacterium]|nr:hypothetical protein [Sedimentisphaerales bacterium]